MDKNKTAWAFDLGKGSIGEAVRRISDNKSLHRASLLAQVRFVEKKKGAAKAPVQELRFTSGSSCDLRSLADRFLRTADPQVLISAQ